MAFGLRYFDGSREFRLLHIREGRLLLFDGLKCWWADPMPAAWEPYETTVGQTYDIVEEAEDVIRFLNGES